MNHFHNTIRFTGDELHNAILLARRQEDAVLAIMSDGKMRGPSQIKAIGDRAGRKWLIGSVRRAVTNLEHDGALVKTDTRIPSPYRSFEHCWQKA